MIAYNNKWLYNRYVRKQADEALHEGCITSEAYDAIIRAKEVGFYSPNYFVRIGLAILTMVVISFMMGMLGMMFAAFSSSFAFLSIIMGIACYAAAQWLVKKSYHFHSGVDNMLLWMAACFVCSGITYELSYNNGQWGIVLSLTCFAVCGVLALRFADTVLSIATVLAFFSFTFLFFNQQAGALARNATPFFMILVAASVYFIGARIANNRSSLFYRACLRCVSVVSLLALFSSGNYYLVRELSNEMFHLGLRPQDPLPLGWFFWAWTFLVPFVYIGVGIRNKNITLIRVGIPLIAVAVLTFRYYHSIMAPEMAMLLGGVILFVASYSLIKYLRTPKNGFTFKPESYLPKDPIAANVTGELFDHSKDIFLQK